MGACALLMTSLAYATTLVGIPWWWSIQTCHDVYGCFSREAPFINSNGYLPQNPKQLNVSLELHTRYGESMIDLTKYTSENHFDKSKKITVIIHGFLGSESVQWVQDMARELLKKGDSNVFVVNWENGADECNYFQAVANTRMVAAIVSKYLEKLLDIYKMKASSIHLIGASLGAHISGYIGQKIKGIGRITGLDPASYGFEGFDHVVTLSPDDASFVDVIHTDDVYGFSKPIGDVDFFVNGGTWQPGCSWTSKNICSHSRAFDIFVESINSPCVFTSFPCQSDQIKEGGTICRSCGNRGCSYMGYGASRYRSGVYYTKTRGETPFCISNSVLP